MYCENCQTEYNDSVIYCPNCGGQTKKNTSTKSKIGVLPVMFIIGSFVLSIAAFCIAFCYFIFTTLSYEVEDIDLKTFEKAIKKEGCNITEYQDNSVLMKGNYYGTTDSCPYKILFAEFDSTRNQYDFYDYLVDDVLNNNGNFVSKFEINTIKYHQNVTKGSYYKNAIMTENTILYLQGNRDDEEQLGRIVEDLGYSFTIDLSSFIILFFVILIIVLINLLLVIITNFKLLQKMGRCGWISLVPFYNTYCFTKGAMGNGWWFLLSFIPGGNMVYAVLFALGLGESFKKSTGFKILLIFFPTVFKPWIAFDDSKYHQPKTSF